MSAFLPAAQNFSIPKQILVHLDVGDHHGVNEGQSFYDSIRRGWATKLRNISNAKPKPAENIRALAVWRIREGWGRMGLECDIFSRKIFRKSKGISHLEIQRRREDRENVRPI